MERRCGGCEWSAVMVEDDIEDNIMMMCGPPFIECDIV